jgi:drug/metabolite transporter (DMT)-like permease
LSTALAQIIVLAILQLRDASFLSLNNYLVPLFGVFRGVLILAERPGPNAGIAFLVILAGVFVSQGGVRLLVRARSRA